MDSGKAGPSGNDKGKGKVPEEKKSRRARTERPVGKRKKKAPRGKGVGDKEWKAGDPLPDSPTPRQIKAHNDALLDAYVSELLPERDVDRGWGSDPRYEELLWNFRYAPPDEGLPEGAETKVVPDDDVECLFESSSDSSECSSEESESESEDYVSDS